MASHVVSDLSKSLWWFTSLLWGTTQIQYLPYWRYIDECLMFDESHRSCMEKKTCSRRNMVEILLNWR